MVYDPNANWSALADDDLQAPVYFLRLEGVTTSDYSTAPVRGASITKLVCLEPPSGGAMRLDPLGGTVQQSPVRVTLLDIDGVATELIATDWTGAAVATLVNRRASIYGGYRELSESDYAVVFSGRITGLEATGRLTGYELTLEALHRDLDGELFSNATATSGGATTVAGPVVNVWYALLASDFTTGGDFPLTTFSTGSAAPTGLGISTASIDTAGLITERDRWHPSSSVTLSYTSPQASAGLFATQFYRLFQAYATCTLDGKHGLRFLMPPIPTGSSLPTLTDDDIVEVVNWRRRLDQHLNRFRYTCETERESGKYDYSLYASDTAEDTADQAASQETITFTLQSDWLPPNAASQTVAATMADRMRRRYRHPPVELELAISMRKRALEMGDVVAVTCASAPNTFTGARGISAMPMRILSLAPDFGAGVIRVLLADASYSRYGLIAYGTQTDYTASSAAAQAIYAFIGDAANLYSDGDAGVSLV